VSATVGPSFANSVQLTTITAHNMNGNLSIVPGNNLPGLVMPAIVDKPSFQILQNTLTCQPSGTGARGQRVASPVLINNSPGELGVLTVYDEVSLLAANELQLAAGSYTTPLNTNAYLDYRPMDGPDYSGTSRTGYRYATFRWQIPQDSLYTTLSFTIDGLTGVDSVPGVPLTVQGQRLELYYRFCDTTQSVPLNDRSVSSIWIDGNNNTGTPIGFNGIPYFQTGQGIPYVPSQWSGAYTFTEEVPNGNEVGSSCFVYCMIGLPMSVTTGFTYVRCLQT